MRANVICLVLLWGGLLAAPAVPAIAPLAPPAQEPAARGSPSALDSTPGVCFSAVFSGPLPGKSDYCLGLRDWNNGHYRNGLELLALAAGWGNKSAQYTLGLIYYNGHHVPANAALGLAWLKLADERHNDAQISRVARSAFNWATPAQRHAANALFRQMEGRYGDKVAAARAWKRLQHWQRLNGAFDSGCVRVFGAQAAAARRLGLAGEPPQSLRPMLRPTLPISARPSGDGLRALKNMMQARQEQLRFGNANTGVCITIQTQQHVTQQLADKYFAGWQGIVTVGPLQVVPAPPSSSGR